MKSRHEHGGTVLAVARQLGVAPESILDFSASINPFGPAAGVRSAITAAIAMVVHYPETGSPRLCRSLAEYHSVAAERIAVANGSTELIHLLPRLNGKCSGQALLIAPTFSEYAHALELAGWHVTCLCLSPESGFALDISMVADELAKGYDLLFFCNPGNPTGRIYSLAEVAALFEICRQTGCFFVLDEAFIDFTEENSAKNLLPESDDWLILRSMTKFFGFPGLRLGYALTSPTLTARLQNLVPPWSVGVLAQAAALAALADQEHCRRTREFVSRERQRLAGKLGQIDGLQVFSGAVNYLLVEITTGKTASWLQHQLLAERILIRDCSNFAGLDNRFFRVAVRNETDNDKLLQALAAVYDSKEPRKP